MAAAMSTSQRSSRLSNAEAAHDCTSIIGGVPVMTLSAISDFMSTPPLARGETDKVAISEARRRDESKKKLPSQIVAALRGAPRKAVGSLCPTRDERRRPRCRAGSALEPLIARTRSADIVFTLGSPFLSCKCFPRFFSGKNSNGHALTTPRCSVLW